MTKIQNSKREDSYIVRAKESTVRYSPQRELKLLTLFEE